MGGSGTSWVQPTTPYLPPHLPLHLPPHLPPHLTLHLPPHLPLTTTPASPSATTPSNTQLHLPTTPYISSEPSTLAQDLLLLPDTPSTPTSLEWQDTSTPPPTTHLPGSHLASYISIHKSSSGTGELCTGVIYMKHIHIPPGGNHE